MRRARALLSLVRDLFPLTPLGLGLGAAAYFGLQHYAYQELDMVWLVVGYATLALCAVSPFPVLCGALWLARAHRRAAPATESPLELQTDVVGASDVALPALRFVPFVQVRWQWVLPVGAAVQTVRRGGRLHERVAMGERGRHARIVRRVVVQDPFGLSRIGLRLTQQRPVRVQPWLGALARLPSLSAYVSGDALPHPLGLAEGDRVELRRYEAGDPARFIHWKVFARTRRLMVRMPERALSPARRTSAFVLAGLDDDASAALARLAVERDLLGGEWRLGTDVSPQGTSRRDEALEWIVESVRARDGAGRGLHAFVDGDRGHGPCRLIVFAPPQPGPFVEMLAALARVHAVQVLVGTDGLRTALPRPLWRRLLSEEVARSGTPIGPLEALLDALARQHLPVTVIDRASGKALGRAHLRASARALATRRAA